MNNEKIKIIFSLFAIIILQLVFFSINLLPITEFLRNNADILYIADISRGLNAGQSLFDWRLTQANYIFPDILLSRVLLFLGFDYINIGLVYQLTFPLVVFCVFYQLCKQRAVSDRLSVLLLFAFIYLAQLVSDVYRGEALPFIFFVGFHSGNVLSLALYLLFAKLILDDVKTFSAFKYVILVAVCFYGAISDFLFVISVSATLITLYAYSVMRERRFVTDLAPLVITTLGIFVVAKAFGFVNPFPQEKEFLGRYIAMFPHLIIPAATNLLNDIVKYSSMSLLVPLVLILTALSVIFNNFLLIKSFFSDVKYSDILIIATGAIAFPLIILIQISFGLYDDVFSARQWAPFLLFVYFVTACYTSGKNVFNLIYTFCIALSIIFFTYSYVRDQHQKKGVVTVDNYYTPILECLQSKHPTGALVADYWLARPLKMYSKYAYSTIPYLGVNMLFTNASNVKIIRSTSPTMVLVGGSLTESDVLSKYGIPSDVYCSMRLNNGYELKIYDYSNNGYALKLLQYEAAHAY